MIGGRLSSERNLVFAPQFMLGDLLSCYSCTLVVELILTHPHQLPAPSQTVRAGPSSPPPPRKSIIPSPRCSISPCGARPAQLEKARTSKPLAKWQGSEQPLPSYDIVHPSFARSTIGLTPPPRVRRVDLARSGIPKQPGSIPRSSPRRNPQVP